MSGNLYYGWHDDSRAPVEQKIADAIAAYVRRFERQPNLVLVNAAEVVAVPGVDVRATSYIRPGDFWVGWEELAQPAPLQPAQPAQRGPVTHDLKCNPEYFGAVRAGCKSFELRRDDRGFAVGDLLLLREWTPAAEQYTGECITVEIGYILRGFPGIEPGYAILSLKEVRHA